MRAPSNTGTVARVAHDEARPDPGSLPPALIVEGVAKQLGRRTILDGIELALAPGATAWISGGNGAGKTTFMRLIAGLIVADRGTISFDGLRCCADRTAYQANIGFLAAGDSGLYARLSVRQNLEFWAGLAFVARSRRRVVIGRAIERFGLADLATRRADRLSLGQRQRVRLALTFLHAPRLVLLDEPAASLDDDGVELLLRAVEDHAAIGGTTVWCAPARQTEVRHDLAFVLRGGRLEPA